MRSKIVLPFVPAEIFKTAIDDGASGNLPARLVAVFQATSTVERQVPDLLIDEEVCGQVKLKVLELA